MGNVARAVRVLGLPKRGHAATDLIKRKAQTFGDQRRRLICDRALLQGEVQYRVQIWHTVIWLKNEHVAAG